MLDLIRMRRPGPAQRSATEYTADHGIAVLDVTDGVRGSQHRRKESTMQIVPVPPTSSEVLQDLGGNDGRHTVLARSTHGTFSARVHRYDFLDGMEPCEGELEVVFDNSQQDGGESWHDLTVLWKQQDNFAKVAVDMIAAAAGIKKFAIVRDRGAGDEWYPAGTSGTPSFKPNDGGSEVFCGTTWRETADGRRTKPTLSVHVGSQEFEPERALKFAVQLAQEAGRALAIGLQANETEGGVAR